MKKKTVSYRAGYDRLAGQSLITREFWTRKRLYLATAVIAVTLMIVAGVVFATWYNRSQYGIPSKVIRQANFSLVVPGQGINPASVRYHADQQTLDYDMATAGGSLIVSQQPTPATFKDPASAAETYRGFNQYGTLPSPVGQAHLTRPAGESGADVTVINTGQTLVFITSTKQLPQSQWRAILESLLVLND